MNSRIYLINVFKIVESLSETLKNLKQEGN